MNRIRIAIQLSLLWVVLPLAGMLFVHPVTAQQSADQTDASSTKKPAESKPAPAAAPASAPADAATAKPASASAPAAKPSPSATTPAATTPPASKPAATQQTPAPKSSGMVWVNTASGIYHKPGSRYYGKTKQGKYMSEADALKAGYRAAGKN